MENYLHLWLGRFEDEDVLSKFFEEQYADRTKPLNGFAASQGQRRYDHDFVEYRVGRGEPIEDLIRLNSYSQFYLEPALEAAKAHPHAKAANLFVLAEEREFKSPVDVAQEGLSLTYLGRFPYQR